MLVRLIRAASIALVVLVPAHALRAQSCTLEYQRADNMWAAYGRPDGALGKEAIALSMGGTKVFATDWKYEKKRNDGTNFFGSHLRIATNTGTVPVQVVVVSGTLDVKTMLNNVLSGTSQLSWNSALVTMAPGATRQFKSDLGEVRCPKS
jgi:hypothetical protein